MSQAVNRISEPNTDGERILQTNNNTNDLNTDSSSHDTKVSKFKSFILIPKTKVILVAMMIIMTFMVIITVINSLYQIPPAKLVVENNNLTPAQYQNLKDTMQRQEIGNFFTTQLPELKDTAMMLPWVSEVSIQRDWHQGIIVSALPRQPVAKFGTERLIDASGQVYVPADSQMLHQPNFANLQGEISQSHLIMQMMQQVNIWFAPDGLEVQDIILSPRMTWLIRFNNGLRIIVDNENTYQKLFNTSQLLHNQLADRKNEIQTLDLRYKNGFAISWKTNVSTSSLEDRQ